MADLTLQEAKEKYTSFVIKLMQAIPEARFIHCTFSGCGDSFDSFNNVEVWDEDESELDIPNSFPDIQEELEFIWWEVIERLGCSFNDDGSEGSIMIDLKTGKVSANYDYYERITSPGGSLEDQQLSELFND